MSPACRQHESRSRDEKLKSKNEIVAEFHIISQPNVMPSD